jgi:hypothetical protein
MRPSHIGTVATLLLGAFSLAARASAPFMLTVNDSGDAGPGNCASTCTLRDAIANVAPLGYIDFAPQLLPATITLTKGALNIYAPLSILGPGAEWLAISANSASRVIDLESGSLLRISGVTLRDGKVAGAVGSSGGRETGADGAAGSSAKGGCIFVYNSSLDLEGTDVRNCVAQAGNGGRGGSGIPSTRGGGPGGDGGEGGSAFGGAIYVLTNADQSYKLELHDSSIADCQAIAGAGGSGGAAGDGALFAGGGNGGPGGSAYGGAIEWDTPLGDNGNVLIDDSTLADCDAIGGQGGNGGTPGGDGAYGGSAIGGLIAGGAVQVTLVFATLANAGVERGAGGSGSPAAGDGGAFGTAIYLDPDYGGIGAQSAVVVGAGTVPLCEAKVYPPSGNNLDQDGSCGFALHGNMTLFRPRSPTGRPHYRPAYGSTLVDGAASCIGVAQTLTLDQLGTTRPQGPACDLGAIEADYVFVGSFD